MSLSSKGCKARVLKIVNVIEGTGIVAEICTYKAFKSGRKPDFKPDFKARVLLYDKEVPLNNGDIIAIKSFYVRNCNERLINSCPSFTITEWEVTTRNKYNPRYYKQKGEDEFRETKIRQRQSIEEEIEAEEQDLDEYIDNNGEDDIPF